MFNKIFFLALFTIVLSQELKVEDHLTSTVTLNKQKDYKMKKEKLTKIQYEVTQNCGTEPPAYQV